MQWKQPKNNGRYQWTGHSLFKMHQYGLSVQKVLGVIKKPERKEEGIVKNTIAVMQPVNPKIQNGKKIWKQEIWAMYQEKAKSQKPKVKSQFENYMPVAVGCRLKIISAWRYPGISPQKDPIPGEILSEVADLI